MVNRFCPSSLYQCQKSQSFGLRMTHDSCRVGDYDSAADREDAIRKLDGCKVDGSIVTVREMVRLRLDPTRGLLDLSFKQPYP